MNMFTFIYYYTPWMWKGIWAQVILAGGWNVLPSTKSAYVVIVTSVSPNSSFFTNAVYMILINYSNEI